MDRKKTEISAETSKRITALRFLLIVFVIFIHTTPSAESGFVLTEPFAFSYVKKAFLELCNTAVPLFFLFAGYLQFSKRDFYPTLLKKRAKSLLVPYLIWTFLGIGFYVAVQSFPQFLNFFSEKDWVRNWNAADYVKAFLYWKTDMDLKQPLLGQFWFIRELMIMIVLSPILSWLAKKCGGFLLVFIIVAYICKIPLLFIVDSRVVFFYMLGWYFAEYEINFFALTDKISWFEYGILFFLIVILKNVSGFVFYGIDVLVCCLIMLKFSYFIIQNSTVYAFAKYLAGFSFFLYAIHWPFIINPLKAIFLKLIPTSGGWCVVQFFVPALLCVIIGTGVGIALKKICSPLFTVLDGGRK